MTTTPYGPILPWHVKSRWLNWTLLQWHPKLQLQGGHLPSIQGAREGVRSTVGDGHLPPQYAEKQTPRKNIDTSGMLGGCWMGCWMGIFCHYYWRILGRDEKTCHENW